MSLVTRWCFSRTAHQRIGSRSDRMVGARNLRLHLSRSLAPNSPDINLVDYWDHATAGLSDKIKECGWTQEAAGWNLDRFGAEHYWHCYQRMEKTSACLCSREGPTFRTFTVAVEQRDIWINCQPEWLKCKPNLIYACYFNKVIIRPCIKCNISLLIMFCFPQVV